MFQECRAARPATRTARARPGYCHPLRMATVSRPRPAPVGLRDGLAGRGGRMLLALLVVAAVPAVLWLIYRPSYVNFDARYSLLWSRDILHGNTPDYTGVFAPTPHPLQTA